MGQLLDRHPVVAHRVVYRKRFWSCRRGLCPEHRRMSSPRLRARSLGGPGRAGPLGSSLTVLLLFDIAGPLLPRAHADPRRPRAGAVGEIWGAEDPGAPAVVAAGRTDIEIAREICLLGGVSAAHF